MSKKERLPWFKLYVEAWLEDTRELTPEQRGIYFDCLCLIYKYDKALPKSDAWMAHQLHVNAKVWRRIRGTLLDRGMLVENATGYMNKRSEAELEERRQRRGSRVATAVERELQRRSAPELPLDFNEAKARLRPQKGLHARASSDHQREKEEEREEKAQALPVQGVDDDDDPYNRRRELDPKIVELLNEIVGQTRAAHILRTYFTSEYAKNARYIDGAFPKWLAKCYHEKITDDLTPKELAAEILAMCGGDTELPKAPPKFKMPA